MDEQQAEAVALHRWAVIAEATSDRLEPAERGALVRSIATRAHTHPDGTARHYSRATLDRWIRNWRRGGLDALRPETRSDTGAVRAHPELADEAAALRLELPSRSAAQIARILFARHGIRVAERTVRQQLARRPLDHRCARRTLGPAPKSHLFGACQALLDRRRPFALVGPRPLLRPGERAGVPRGTASGHRASGPARGPLCRQRGTFQECLADQDLCRARGPPVHSRPYSPQGRGKQERANRFIREAFLQEAMHQGIDSLDQLDDLFIAWAEQVANRRVHAETNEVPIERFDKSGPRRGADPERLVQAFRWSVSRKVTRTATVSLEGNTYAVDPALLALRVELRYDPEDLSAIDVFFEGSPAGVAVLNSASRK